MLWTEEHDKMLIREIFLYEVWEYRHGSQERGQLWENIADSLNKLHNPQFRVTQRSVRDRFAVLVKNHKAKKKEEDRASGISPEQSEVDDGMLQLIEHFDQADNERGRLSEEKKKEKEAETMKAEEFRQASLETFGQSCKRKEGDLDNEPCCSSGKRGRTTGTETINYLREKTEREFSFRKEELELKRTEQNYRKQEIDLAKEQQKAFLAQFKESQQMQQQNMLMMIQRQQQQGQLMMALLEKFASK